MLFSFPLSYRGFVILHRYWNRGPCVVLALRFSVNAIGKLFYFLFPCSRFAFVWGCLCSTLRLACHAMNFKHTFFFSFYCFCFLLRTLTTFIFFVCFLCASTFSFVCLYVWMFLLLLICHGTPEYRSAVVALYFDSWFCFEYWLLMGHFVNEKWNFV